LSKLSEVWEHPESSIIILEFYYQAMPFRGWGIDLIGQINPPSSKGHKFVLLATDYFTKWVEAIPRKKVTS
jgi:hypothetical protein